MPRIATLAALLLAAAISVLAQQPVYPNFPPPPAPSGENAPHPQAPDSPYPDSQQPDSQQPNSQQPNQQGASPQDQGQQPAYPNAAPAQKPSPYPQPDGSPTAQQAPYDPAGASAYPSDGNSLAWVPQGMEALGRTAAFHTDFTFDRSMLQLASGLWDGPSDPATASAMSRLDGISVHTYHYAAPGMYDPRLLEIVRQQYGALGWQHLVTAHPHAGDGATDLWISFHHMQVTGAVVLFQNASNLNLIAFSGNLSPLDLLHLRGHFGIPRFPGDHFVPAPGPSARIAPPPPSY